MPIEAVILILFKLLPVLFERMVSGKEWQNLRLGEIVDLKPYAEVKEELKRKRP